MNLLMNLLVNLSSNSFQIVIYEHFCVCMDIWWFTCLPLSFFLCSLVRLFLFCCLDTTCKHYYVIKKIEISWNTKPGVLAVINGVSYQNAYPATAIAHGLYPNRDPLPASLAALRDGDLNCVCYGALRGQPERPGTYTNKAAENTGVGEES